MAKWQIDRFKVKPSGFLASWRERAVFTDDDGNVTSECVAGKECMNLPCISTDYAKTDRRYEVGDLITQYCNITTHSRWYIYAQDCEPFANAVEELNVPACGYLEPLPAPSVPSNPFGTSPYGLYVFYNFCDKNNVTGVVNIYRKGFVGTPLQIESGGYAPVVLKYKDTDNKFEPILSMEAVFTFIATENFQLSYLYSGDQREFKAEVIKASVTEFTGFIIPDSCSEPFAQPSYPVSIRATDGIGALQKLTYPMPSSSSVNVRQRWIDILAYCLSLTNLNLNIRTACNLYEQKMLTGIDDDPLAQSSVNPLRFTDGDSIDTAYDVLKAVCNQFTATLKQVNGEWVFIRNPELTQEFIRTRLYLYTGFFIRGEQIRNVKTAGVRNTDFITEATPQISIGNAYKRAVVRLDYGVTSMLVQNGAFEQWDGQNFERWTKFGGINIGRYQKTISGSGGARIPVEDYAALFLETFQAGKYLQSTAVEVFPGDEVKLSFDVGPTQGASILRLRVRVGQYYLVEEVTGADPNFNNLPPDYAGNGIKQSEVRYIWVTANQQMYKNPYTNVVTTEATYARVYIDNPQMDKPNLFRTISIQMPALPVIGEMFIQVFGFENQKSAYPTSGIAFDNVKLSTNSDNNETIPEGVLYVSEQLGFYTESPEEIPIIFGEFNELSRRLAFINNGSLDHINGGLNTDLYAIYTADNSFAKGWKTFGESGAYNPIGLAASRAIIKAYQKPFMFYSGVLAGSDFSHLNVFRIVVECDAVFSEKIFMQMGVTYDLVNNKIDGTLVEIFSRPIFTNDGVVDNFPDTELPPFVQNPTQPKPLTGGKIFTPEFTEQFV